MVERLVARHRDREVGVLVRGLDLGHDVLDLVVDDRERERGRVPILGYERAAPGVEVAASRAERARLALGDEPDEKRSNSAESTV